MKQYSFVPPKNNIIILVLLFFLSAFTLSIHAKKGISYNSGLSFSSYETEKENRTSLYIPVSQIKGIANEFSISFKFKFTEGKHNFGYIFRLLGEKDTNLDLVVSELKTHKKLSLIYTNKSVLQSDNIPDFGFDSWNEIVLSFSSQNITLTVNGLTRTTEIPYEKFSPQNLYFGGNQDSNYFTTEVPPMTIKDIHFYNKAQKEIAYWPLDKHAENIAYDVRQGIKATALNPKWEIDSHYCWEMKESFAFDIFPQIAFDSISEKLYIAQSHKIAIYDVRKEKLEYLDNMEAERPFELADQLIYDPNHHQLLSYVVGYDDFFSFDLAEKKWKDITNEDKRLQFLHHSRIYLPQDSLLIAIGGYGYHQYKGMMMKYPFATGKWEGVDISSSFSPRYLGSMGYLGNGKLLYFGGYGSESGKQEESPHNYYDLYEININDNSVKKLWEKKMDEGEEHYTNSNSMVIDKEQGVFYTLTYINKLYNTQLQIREFSIHSPESRLVGNTIPYIFNDVRSYCDLFLCPKSGKLLAVTTHTKESEGISNIEIYTIAYRPFAEEDIIASSEISSGKGIIFTGIILLLFVACVIIYMVQKKKRKSDLNPSEGDSYPEEEKYSQRTLDIDWNEEIATETIPSSIILLGGFQVINKEGKDITRQFSPTIKSLFLLILLATFKTGKGITSAGLRDILWSDKDDNSARNNRNVNLSKLRPLLQKVGEIEVTDDNRYWSVSLGKGVYCDYQAVIAISSKINAEQPFNKALFLEFIRIVSPGLLLPNTHAEWLDSYKSEYSSSLIEFLLKISIRPEVEKDYELLTQIGDMILLHDTIDEDGLRLKCYGLYKSNKKGKALQCYNKFCEDYKTLLNEEYKEEFNSLVKKGS